MRYLNLPFFTPKAWMQEKVLQKMKKVSTMQSTASNWLKEVSRILGRSKTTKDMELARNPIISIMIMTNPPTHHFQARKSCK